MPISFTDAFNVDKTLFDETGAFDPILDVDSKFFIDPALLPESSCPEFSGSKEEVEGFFSQIMVLLKHSSRKGDRYWRKADKMLTFQEIKGTCLGYSSSGVCGNSIGPKLRGRLLRSIKELQQAGAEDPVIFELLGVFEEGVGCDRISDLLTFKLRDRIYRYTERVLRECRYAGPLVECGNYRLPYSTYSKSPVLLLPKEILHPLPLAKKFSDIAYVCHLNERVRDNVNEWFDFSDGKKPAKSEVFRRFLLDEEFFDSFVEAYKEADAERYDFSRDVEGERSWYDFGKAIAAAHPLILSKTPPSRSSLEEIVMSIVEHFKEQVEKNGVWRVLYKEDGSPRKELIAQRLFAAIASSYCEANDIDMSPEANNGNGPVDFKFSSGYHNKVLVELKMSGNTQLDHCMEKQIPIYMEQEHTDKAVYLLVKTGNDRKVQSFADRYAALDADTKRKVKLVVVDATAKESASKA